MLWLLSLFLSLLFAQSPDLNQKIKEMDEFLIQSESQGIYSGNLGIYKNGKILFLKSYGYSHKAAKKPNYSNSTFNIGSITKQFVGASYLLLQRKKLLSIHDSIGKYIENLPPQKSTIKLVELLTHSSGLSDLSETVPKKVYESKKFKEDPDYALKMYFHYVKVGPKKFNYNNFGYTVLVRILEKVTHSPYEIWLRENVFKPAGLKLTFFRGDIKSKKEPSWLTWGHEVNQGIEKQVRGDLIEYDWTFKGADGILMSLFDLFHWTDLLFSQKILNQKELTELLRPRIWDEGYQSWYGLGWSIEIDPQTKKIQHIYHPGGTFGYLSYFDFNPQTREGIIFFANRYELKPYDEIKKIWRK